MPEKSASSPSCLVDFSVLSFESSSKLSNYPVGNESIVSSIESIGCWKACENYSSGVYFLTSSIATVTLFPDFTGTSTDRAS